MKTEQIISEELAARIAAFERKVLTEPLPSAKAPAPKAPEAEVVAGPWPRPQLSEAELIRRQQQLDWWWEQRLDEEREREREARMSFPRLRLDLTEPGLRNFLIDEERIGIACTKFRSSSNNGWSFPPLAEARAAWEQLYGPIKWDCDVEEWRKPQWRGGE
jgi:hypothetical protein